GTPYHRMAVQPHYLVEQLGAEAVHHAHDDDQRGNAEHDRADRKPRDDEDEALAFAWKQIAAGEHPLGAVENHAPTSLASADSTLSSCFSPVARFLSSTEPVAMPRGPTISCHGRPIRSIDASLAPPRSSRSS